MPHDISFEVLPPRTLRRGLDRELNRRKTDEAEQAGQLRSLFLASMPHELRTPLNAIIGFSDLLLQDRAALTPEQARSLGDILTSGRRLLALVNPLIDLATLEAGRTLLELNPLDPAEQVRGACALAAPVAQKKRIRLEQEVGGSKKHLLADRRHLQQILLQLLANAFGASPAGSRVTLRVEDLDCKVRFSVRDDAPGFPQRSNGEAGLATTRLLVERHGGVLHVETEPGGGTTVWFDLPVDGPNPRAVA